MSTEIKIKRGSGTTPTLADGELGFNKSNKILTIGTDQGNVDIGRPIKTISQNDYDALGTKDSNTIYIIESDDAVVTQSAMEAYAAPSGYGLGTRAVQASNYDANNAVRSGWYFAGINVPTNGYWLIRVDSYDGIVYCKQTAYAIATASSTDSMCVCRRYQEQGAWSEWEWENPPMTPGVEYRTTERYNGKPVYVKYVSAACNQADGSSVVDVNIPHGISNFGVLIKVDANINGLFALPSISGIDQLTSIQKVDATNIILRCCRDAWSGSTLNAILYYTKA